MLPAGTAYGRTVALNATLGAALVAGLAGGGAAAAADQRGPASVVSFPWPTEFRTPAPTSLEMGSTGIEALRNRMVPVRPAPDSLPEVEPTLAGSAGAGTAGGLAPREVAPTTLGDSDLGPSRWQPRPAPTRPGVTAGLSAEAVRRKPRPVVGSAHAAWVHPNPSSVVTSCFGQRWGRQHQGVDLASPEGSPIVAAGAGVVVRAGEAGGYGNAVLIDHGNGYLTHYGHLATIGVHAGQHVAAGEQIGEEGSTGHSTGPHLHFEVHEDYYKSPIEPLRWLREHGVDVTGCADPA